MRVPDLWEKLKNSMQTFVEQENTVVNEEVILYAVGALELSKEPFDSLDLHVAVQDKIGISIAPRFLDSVLDYPSYTVAMKHHVLPGGVAFNATVGCPEVYLFNKLEGWEQDETHYFCLAHLILGHALPIIDDNRSLGRGIAELSGVDFWTPPKAVVKQKPPVNLEVCRTNLEERTRYLAWAQLQAASAAAYLHNSADRGSETYSRTERLLGIRKL